MSQGERLTLPVADGWQVRELDSEHTAVVFTYGENKSGVVLPNDALSQFISHTLKAAARYAASHSPPLQDGQTIDAILLPVTGIASVPGRTMSETVVAVQVGNLTLSLALDAATLLQFAASVVAATIPKDQQLKH